MVVRDARPLRNRLLYKRAAKRQMVESRVGCLQPETWLQRGGRPGDLTPEGLEHLHDAGNALLTLRHSGMAAGFPDTDRLQFMAFPGKAIMRLTMVSIEGVS